MSQLQCLRGMVDLLPAALQRWQAVEAVARGHFQRSGLVRFELLYWKVPICFAVGSAKPPMWSVRRCIASRIVGGVLAPCVQKELPPLCVRQFNTGCSARVRRSFGTRGRCSAMNARRPVVNVSSIRLASNGLAPEALVAMWR